MTDTQHGACLCKAIRYSLTGEPIYNVICHCDNCRKASGSQMVCASIWPRKQFTLTGTPKTFNDTATDSSQPLARNFCGKCGSNVFATTSLNAEIVSIFSGTLDDARDWTPNKEQYIETKSHWLPFFSLIEKEGMPQRHKRGPFSSG